ncbi:hypothetical protein EOD42_23460 [Rhodovarius crocodyli]|uniref:Sulfotransferase n=1 Tax=Rhodovarius crocodyli TaxID=1979269 RepID=A0A437LZ46_9PROT|nr:hypothetical protein [Rhodovarius crocodyli]RVT90593.1 hypothetical protein EOD42_23460 [Rhodovarius crocodyli]
MTRILFVVGPARSGVTAMSGALSHALRWPQRDVSAELARVSLVADAARRQAARLAEIGEPPPPGGLLSERMAQALLADILQGCDGPGIVLRAAEILPEPAVLTGLRRLLPFLPSARAVIMRRGAVENVAGRLRARPRMGFAAHCMSWAAATLAGEALVQAAPAACLPVEFAAVLTDPGMALAGIARFCGLAPATATLAAGWLRDFRPAGTGLDPVTRAPGLAGMGWSTPEKMMFLDLCGPAMAATGQSPEKPAAALLGTPLHLGEMARDGRLRVVGMEAMLPPERAEGTVRLRATGAAGAVAHFPLMAPAGRDRFEAVFTGLAANGADFGLRLEIVSSLSRQVLLAREWGLPAGGHAGIRQDLMNLPAMVDVILSFGPRQEYEGCGLDMVASFASGDWARHG